MIELPFENRRIEAHCSSHLRGWRLVVSGDPFPTVTAMPHAMGLYREQARQIADALATMLPGGTLDQLTAALLERRASVLRTAHTWGGSKDSRPVAAMSVSAGE